MILIELYRQTIEYLVTTIESLGYFGIYILMTIESSFVPFPSEAVMIPAGISVSQGNMNFYLVFISGVLGSITGALINYFLALYLGRKIIYFLVNKYGKFVLIKEKNIVKSEIFFRKYGNIATLIGRLIPVIRQLISIPAGFSKMNLYNFIFYTTIGSGIWMLILLLIGIGYGNNEELILSNIKLLIFGTLLICIIGITTYILFKKTNKKNKNLKINK